MSVVSSNEYLSEVSQAKFHCCSDTNWSHSKLCHALHTPADLCEGCEVHPQPPQVRSQQFMANADFNGCKQLLTGISDVCRPNICFFMQCMFLHVSVPAQTVVWSACWQSLLCLWGLWPECVGLLCSPQLFPPYEHHPDNRYRQKDRNKERHQRQK